MAVILFLVLSIICLHIYRLTHRRSTSAPTNWPVVGMTPALIQNGHRLHEYGTEVLREYGGTYAFKGPWLANRDMLVTCDPANIHHILSKNFANYPKGLEFQKIFDILGDGIFNADSELWEFHRKTTMSFINGQSRFHHSLEITIWNKVEDGLIPVLELVSKEHKEVDLQEIFQKFAFDNICSLVLNHDPRSLSTDFPYIPCEKAFTETEEALLHRHILPESLWKFQKWLGIGKEKKLSKSWEAFDQFIYRCISTRGEPSERAIAADDKRFDLITTYMKAYKEKISTFDACTDLSKFLRDTTLSLMLAGRDTTSTGLTWFFWLLTKNPSAETKILEEIKSNVPTLKGDNGEKPRFFFSVQELSKLIYLHGALCETLRLFPPVALEHKAPVQPDYLPSGHWIDKSTKVVMPFYSMGRMESIWGKDCLEFKPERWISERGGIKHEPSFKFPAFNAGPRTCIGKEMGFVQMKVVAAAIIYSYHVALVEGHPVSPSDSIILQMKYGLKVRVSKRASV